MSLCFPHQKLTFQLDFEHLSAYWDLEHSQNFFVFQKIEADYCDIILKFLEGPNQLSNFIFHQQTSKSEHDWPPKLKIDLSRMSHFHSRISRLFTLDFVYICCVLFSKKIFVFDKNRSEFLLHGSESFGRSYSMLKRKFPLVDIKKFNH